MDTKDTRQVVKEDKLRNPHEEVEIIIDKFIELAKTNILYNHFDKYVMRVALLEGNNQGLVKAWYDNSGLLVGILLYGLGHTWWTLDVMVLEEMVLCLDDNFAGFQRLAIEELHNIAKENNSDVIIVGNLLSHHKTQVNNGYLKAGFKLGYDTLIKNMRR